MKSIVAPLLCLTLPTIALACTANYGTCDASAGDCCDFPNWNGGTDAAGNALSTLPGICNEYSWGTQCKPECDEAASCCDHACPATEAKLGGDPVTTFQGEETRYWLSTEHFTPIFEQGPLVLSQLAGPANPPPGLENHKGAWVMANELKIAGLDSILVEAVDPTTLLARPNATTPPASDALTTMRLSFAGKQLKAGEHELVVSDMRIAVRTKADPDQKIGRGFVEQIDIKAEGLHLRITSSKANKFADETVQLLGLHLDVQFLEFEQDKVRGALPEMWGLQPMSKETKLLLEKPAGF